MSVKKFAALIFASIMTIALFAAGARSQAHTEQRKDVRSKIFQQVLADFPDIRECVEKEEGGTRAAAEKMSVEEVDLNRDGVSEYEVELSGPCTCGMVNCFIYLYRQAPRGYELILDGASGYGFELLKTSSNGYLDVRVTARDTAATQDETTYKFDGKQYREGGSRVINLETGESKPAYRRVQFKRGTSSATLQGKVSIALPDTYLIGARAGQVMTVQLTAPRRSVTFMVMNSRTTAMLADNTRSWTGTLPETGDYHIVVGADEKGGTYVMTITIK
jgi:hypothetical protein